MSKANNEVYGTSYIPPNQLGDAFAVAEQVVFQGISTLSSFQFVQSGDYLQMYAVSPTLPPLFTTETYLPAYTSIAEVIGRTQHMGIDDNDTEMLTDLDMNNNNIKNVNEIQVNDVNLGGHHLTTDGNGDLLIDGVSADAKWYVNPVPNGSNVKFLSANPLSPINTLYTPNGTDLWYNNVNLTGGGGGGGGEDWATYPANSNVVIPSPYGLSVGDNAPVATFPTITLCGNTTIGRASAIPLNAPNVEIYPYNFNVGSDLYPALSIELQSGLGGTTIETLEGISLDALIDVNINAGAVIALDATADINLLAVGEISMESANMNVIVGAVETTATTIINAGATSITNTSPLISMNGADFNVLSGATSIESATTSIASGAVSIVGSATANIASPLTTLTGALLGLNSATTTMSGNIFMTGGTASITPTGILTLGNTTNTATTIAGNTMTFNTATQLNVNTGITGMALANNAPFRVGNITDWNGALNIRASNVANDSVSLCNVAYINSVNGTSINNFKIGSNIQRLAFTGNINQGDIINLSSIKAQSDLYITVPDDLIINADQVAMTAPTEIDLNSQNLLKLESATQVLINGATTNINSATTNITATNQVNINAPVVNIPNASHNTSVINCSTIMTSTITTNGNIFPATGTFNVIGQVQATGNMIAPNFVAPNNAIFPIQGNQPTYPGTVQPVFITGAYPCYRYSIPITGLPANQIQLNVRVQVQIANSGFPAFYGAGYGPIILNTSAASKWYYRAVLPGAGAFPNTLDDDQEIVGDIVNTFLAPITANSVPSGSTYGEGITLAFNKNYKLFNRAEVDLTWDLYGFVIQSPYTPQQATLTVDINYWILS
jgi:hypothetical protein